MKCEIHSRTATTIATEDVTDGHEVTMTVDPEALTVEDAIETDNPVDPEGRLVDATTALGDRSAMEIAKFVSMPRMTASEDLLALADLAVDRDA